MSRGAMLSLGCLLAGVALMIPFEHWLTRLLGVVALFAFVIAGVFSIASPEFLDGDRDDVAGRDREPSA